MSTTAPRAGASRCGQACWLKWSRAACWRLHAFELRTILPKMTRHYRTVRIAAAVSRYVVDLDESCAHGRDLLGGKGSGLVEMRQLGIAVPDAFVVTTAACRAYRAAGRVLPDAVEEELDEPGPALHTRTG